MAGASTWLVIIIIGILAVGYFYPDKLTDTLKDGGDNIKSVVGDIFDKKASCPSVSDPVCGTNGVTYNNACYAIKAEVNYTGGICGSQ